MTTCTDARVRLLRGSTELQTEQSHAIMGTPCDVPVPEEITSIALTEPSMTKKSRRCYDRHATSIDGTDRQQPLSAAGSWLKRTTRIPKARSNGNFSPKSKLCLKQSRRRSRSDHLSAVAAPTPHESPPAFVPRPRHCRAATPAAAVESAARWTDARNNSCATSASAAGSATSRAAPARADRATAVGNSHAHPENDRLAQSRRLHRRLPIRIRRQTFPTNTTSTNCVIFRSSLWCHPREHPPLRAPDLSAEMEFQLRLYEQPFDLDSAFRVAGNQNQ